MNQAQGKSATFWVILAVAGACLGCSTLSAGLAFFGFFVSDDVTAAPPVAVRARATLPTGNTPDLFPGMPGWLPSGRGVEIPPALVEDGRPEGLWWHYQTDGAGRTSAELMLFLADGTRATHPRPGGGTIFDREGQRAQKGTTGLGTFELADLTITQHHDGFSSTDPFRFEDGALEIGAARYWPLELARAEDITGTWKSTDGTLDLPPGGSWILDGYLLQLRPGLITTVGVSGKFLIVGATIYERP